MISSLPQIFEQDVQPKFVHRLPWRPLSAARNKTTSVHLQQLADHLQRTALVCIQLIEQVPEHCKLSSHAEKGEGKGGEEKKGGGEILVASSDSFESLVLFLASSMAFKNSGAMLKVARCRGALGAFVSSCDALLLPEDPTRSSSFGCDVEFGSKFSLNSCCLVNKRKYPCGHADRFIPSLNSAGDLQNNFIVLD